MIKRPVIESKCSPADRSVGICCTVKPVLLSFLFLALSACAGIGVNPLLCCRSGPTVAAAASQLPPTQAGMARVWFLRQLEPGESLATPMISANGAPVGPSELGTAFMRDFVPGTYSFTVPSYGVDSGQTATLRLAAGTQTYLEIQSLRNWAGLSDNEQRDTLYVRQISAQWAERYFPTLTYLGPLRS